VFRQGGIDMPVANAPERLASASQSVIDEVRKQLQSSPHYPIRGLRCDFYEGVVTLRGPLPSYYLRQLAQSLVLKVAGVLELDDRIVVNPASSADTGHVLFQRSLDHD
jgi:osmotically-inducible protein OsmY